MSILFMGVDAGGTGTRALLATQDGHVVGTGRSVGANSWSSGTSVAKVVVGAVREALGHHAASSVAGGVIAIAGGGADSAPVGAEVQAGWSGLGLAGSPRIVVDVVAAYAAGTVAPRGLVVAAGTGAIAAIVSNGRLEHRSGGHGWLVGDEGSAVWLGVEGIRAVLMALDGRGPETALREPLRKALDIGTAEGATLAAQMVIATYGRPPARLGRLAPAVIEAADAGDEVAGRLVETAADHLARLAEALDGGEAVPAIVLAGSLLTQAAQIGARSSVGSPPAGRRRH